MPHIILVSHIILTHFHPYPVHIQWNPSKMKTPSCKSAQKKTPTSVIFPWNPTVQQTMCLNLAIVSGAHLLLNFVIHYYMAIYGISSNIIHVTAYKSHDMGVSGNRGIPSHHPFLDGIFPNKNHPFLGSPMTSWKPPYAHDIAYSTRWCPSSESLSWFTELQFHELVYGWYIKN